VAELGWEEEREVVVVGTFYRSHREEAREAGIYICLHTPPYSHIHYWGGCRMYLSS